jgi:hypothetical protein
MFGARLHFMNTSSHQVRCSVFLAGLLLAGTAAQAQMPGAGAPAGMSAALIKLFGDVKAFTAKAEIQVLDASQKERATMPMDFALLDKMIRVQLDLTQMKSSDMPAGAAEQLKSMGMAQVVSIVRPDKKVAYVIYPEQKMMMTMPLPKSDTDAAEKDTKLQKTALGKETVDGHSCVKNKVLMTDEKGTNVEAITWNASDLKDFPVQIQTQEKENTSIIRFKQVQFTKPDAKQFEVPAGYTQYSSPQEMMQGMMKKMMENEKK